MDLFEHFDCRLALVCVSILSHMLCQAAHLPTFRNVQGASFSRLEQLEQAVMDAITLARVVVMTFHPCPSKDEIYQRYFMTLDAIWVRQVFDTIANVPPDQKLDADTIIEIMTSASVAIELQPKFGNLEIALGNHPDLPEDQQLCGKDEFLLAFTFTSLAMGDFAYISICDVAWQYPSLGEIENPPESAKDNGVPMPGYTCDGLGDHDSDFMTTPGGVLLHELMHWPYLIEGIPNYDMIEEGPMGLPQIKDFEGPTPPNGYGAFNAKQLTRDGIQNADNYHWYAQSKYWSWRYKKTFGPSMDPKDDTVRLGRRLAPAPPESDEA